MSSSPSSTSATATHPRLDRKRSARVPGGQGRSRLTLYLDAAERAELEVRCELTGDSMSKVVKDATFHPRGSRALNADAIPQSAEIEAVANLRDMRRKLQGVATNLNQVAHHANTVHEIPADFSAVVAQVASLIEEINDILVEVR